MRELDTHRSRCLHFGVDGHGNGSVNLNTKAGALASTANSLKGH
jgi:membrane-bound lytic murein transglycosylase B